MHINNKIPIHLNSTCHRSSSSPSVWQLPDPVFPGPCALQSMAHINTDIWPYSQTCHGTHNYGKMVDNVLYFLDCKYL